MITLARKINIHRLKHLRSTYRCVFSGRFPQQVQDAPSNPNKSGTNGLGYGEKEIFLLGPIDRRTPLPGNTGIPPLSLLCTNTLSELPKPAGDKCDLTVAQLPEERYNNLLGQVACVAVEDSLFNIFECAGHECPELLKNDFLDLFPTRNLSDESLTVITLSQKTKNDMSQWSVSAEEEREFLQTSFLTSATAICTHLKLQHYWADFIHPNSGRPASSLTNATMFETDVRYRNFGFDIEDLGCCRVIIHRSWGTHVFVGAIFTNAPLNGREIQDILNKYQPNTVNM